MLQFPGGDVSARATVAEIRDVIVSILRNSRLVQRSRPDVPSNVLIFVIEVCRVTVARSLHSQRASMTFGVRCTTALAVERQFEKIPNAIKKTRKNHLKSKLRVAYLLCETKHTVIWHILRRALTS